MPMLIDITAFLVSARTGGFSAAAREIGTTPSVVSKRVGRLEDEIGTRLFTRTTRALSLTPEGERLQPRLQQIVAELDDALDQNDPRGRLLRGTLRLRAPASLGSKYVGPLVTEFQKLNPGISVELHLIDRQVNPLEENFDLSLGASMLGFGGLRETALAPYPRKLVASPAYIAERGMPLTLQGIAHHECITFLLLGHTWTFDGPTGQVSIGVRGRLTVNDSRTIVGAAVSGMGIAIVPEFHAYDALREGTLVEVMPGYSVAELWFKTLVPNHKAHRPEIRALVDFLRASFAPPPWTRDRPEATPTG